MSEPLPSTTPSGAQLRQRLVIAVAGLGILLAAIWLSLIIVSRIDELFFPGQGIGGLPPLPGVQQDTDAEGTINILVMGLDRRPSEGDAPTRTDTIFVVTIDARSKAAGILGVPRDSWVDVPFPSGNGSYKARINTVYATGETQGYDGGGAALLQEVVEQNFGIPTDRYVIIDFEGFVDMIDELGGIDVFVTEEVYDPTYSRTELPGDFYPLFFEVGEQHMDGLTALDYSRTRYGSTDLDRIQRQQQVIFAAIDKALEQRLVSIDKLVGLWGRYKDTIDTDINDLQAPGYAALAAQIDPSRIAALSLATAAVDYITPFGERVLLIDKGIVQQLVDALFSEQQLSSEAAIVEVQSSSTGLANQVVNYLASFGFSSDALATGDTGTGGFLPLTEIIDFSGKEHTVERLASLLNVSPEQIRRAEAGDDGLSTVENADIVVVLGADLLARDFVVEEQGG
ncbi:MAG: LCP family protein [Chloroflexi bacterium]|nr:LCP family protein [Chloroflexota bacterium]